ncbi:hypothetical protein Ddye_003429 [Dipteronia dyeriana]|uniref:MULE transposase domain-containing protein n=1 Tax=Dipteronia dyeriana TaxID=168575 RepID=A0AAE0CVC4_9ROSI|nr:hypothetical protein Ddye_003429 [Dipteronia dyeriana]
METVRLAEGGDLHGRVERLVGSSIGGGLVGRRGCDGKDESYKDIVRSFINEHTCPLEEIHRSHRQASAVIIGEVVTPRLQQQDSRLTRPNNIIVDMKTMHGIQIMYIRGFQRCMRQVIIVHGTHLKGRFGGTMFVATAQDENEQVYSIALSGFLDCLKGVIDHIDDLVFISDRHASIVAGISKVFPYATHTICCWHFYENIKKRYHRKYVAAIMDKAARAYTELQYNRHMEELRNLHPNTYEYVIDAGPHKWSRAHCPNRRAAQSMRHQLTDATHLMILKRVEKCNFMTVNPVDRNIFSVKRAGK